jgi:transposase-like protein
MTTGARPIALACCLVAFQTSANITRLLSRTRAQRVGDQEVQAKDTLRREPYLYLDGIVMKRTWAGEVRNVSLLVASAVNSEGFREILGICEGAKEDKSGWSASYDTGRSWA